MVCYLVFGQIDRKLNGETRKKEEVEVQVPPFMAHMATFHFGHSVFF